MIRHECVELARKYYKKILEAQPNMQDYLNAGHTEWVLQNNKAALDFYKQAVEKENGDWFKFYNQFEQDIPDLKKAGIEEGNTVRMYGFDFDYYK